MAYNSFEDLEVWKRACNLTVEIYKILKNCRDHGLKDQMTRAAVSIASNIAEGAERGSDAEFIRFLHIAKGSTAELRTQAHIAGEIDVMSQEQRSDLIEELTIISKQLQSLIKHLKNKPNT